MKLGRRTRFVGRGRERTLWLLGAAVLFAVLWALAQQFKWPVWVQAMLAGLAAAGAIIIPELRSRFGQDDTRAQLVGQRVTVSAGSRRLPLVGAVVLDQLRVHSAQVEMPYIKRDQQGELEQAVGPGRAVLVVGHSMSGKTRLAAEVVKRKFPDAALLATESGKALREVFDGGLDPAGIVVWLDDLERFLGADGLTVNLLNRLITGRAIVVATIRIEQREMYRPQDKLRPPQWEVLQKFSEIRLERRLTGPELERVRAAVNDPDVLAAVDHYGLAEYLGAGPEALDKFDDGEIANPVGQALVLAAADWRRTGLTRPVSQQVLLRMLPTYLADRPDVPRNDQEAINKGLEWATTKINETVALLRQVFTDSNGPLFEAFDYLIDQFIRTSTPVPDPMWALAMEQADSAELIDIGWVASHAGKLATAETALRQAADKGDSDAAPKAATNLGVLLQERGDVEGAKAAYRQAIASVHADAAPTAGRNLGMLLQEQGDVEGAKAAYQRVIESGHADEASTAGRNLGMLLQEQGDVEGAKAAFQRVIDSGHVNQAPKAAFNLGYLLQEQGDVEGAKAAFQRVIDSGDADRAPPAALILGDLLHKQGDVEGAKAAYRQAIASGHADAAPMAGRNLGMLLQEQGDVEGAKAAYLWVIESGHADEASKAATNLGVLLQERGDVEGAKAAYLWAMDSGHADAAAVGAYILGGLLDMQGDVEGAKAAYQRAIESGHADAAPRAGRNLGVLLEEQGDVEGAKAAYQRVIDSGHTDQAPKAGLNLGSLLWQQGDLEGAKAAYQLAIDSGHPEVAPRAAYSLELLLRTTPPPAAS